MFELIGVFRVTAGGRSLADILKSSLRVRPVYYWTPHRICAHVRISVFALLLERVAELACGDTWRNIRDDLKQIKLAQLVSSNGTVWQMTEPGLKQLFGDTVSSTCGGESASQIAPSWSRTLGHLAILGTGFQPIPG